MPGKKFLSPETKEKLQQAFKESDDPQIRERVLILLLLNARHTQEEVSEIIGCSVRTVAYWWAHANPEDLDSLKDERMKGNNQKATPEYIQMLLETSEKEPAECGYEFGRWTATKLANYLEIKTGIKLSSRQVDRILKAKK
jgi:transposase